MYLKLLLLISLLSFSISDGHSAGIQQNQYFKYTTSNIDSGISHSDSSQTNLKSRQRAINLALLTTVGSIVIVPLAPFGVIIGPSAGSIYAGEFGDALTGSLSRLGSVSLTVLGAFYLLDEQDVAGNVMVWTGLGTLVYSVIHHIWFVGPRNVDAYNERIQKKNVVRVTPWVGNSNEKYVLGGSLRWSFR